MDYTIRTCTSRDELAACLRLQKKIWGYSDLEVYPLRLFVNLGHIGGHAIGAFTPQGKMVGFVASMPAWRGRRRYFHSLSLGVLPEHENRGVGRGLKLAQRELALAAGVELIEWTFDPLRAKNAFLNLMRLWAICRRYLSDYYGEVDSDFQRGLPSDRLVAEWWINSARVCRILQGKTRPGANNPPAIMIEIPADIEALKKRDPARARRSQEEVKHQFQEAFSRRLAVTGFEIDGAKARYLLEDIK